MDAVEEIVYAPGALLLGMLAVETFELVDVVDGVPDGFEHGLAAWAWVGVWDLERVPIFMALNSILNAARMPIFEAKMPLKCRNAEKNSDIQMRINCI